MKKAKQKISKNGKKREKVYPVGFVVGWRDRLRDLKIVCDLANEYRHQLKVGNRPQAPVQNMNLQPWLPK